MPSKKIVIIGPESTGKSSLSEALAKHYGTTWCPEYAREYLLAHGKQYQFDELLTIAKGQIKLEDQYTESLNRQPNNNQSMLFIDTDMYVMKVWCEFVFETATSGSLTRSFKENMIYTSSAIPICPGCRMNFGNIPT